jgi:hypothetical protein
MIYFLAEFSQVEKLEISRLLSLKREKWRVFVKIVGILLELVNFVQIAGRKEDAETTSVQSVARKQKKRNGDSVHSVVKRMRMLRQILNVFYHHLVLLFDWQLLQPALVLTVVQLTTLQQSIVKK